MKRTVAVLLCSIFIDILSSERFTTHGIIILPDTSERWGKFAYALGASSSELISALDIATAPILTTSVLIKNILKVRQAFDDFVQMSDQELEKKYAVLDRFNTPEKRLAYKNYFIDLLALEQSISDTIGGMGQSSKKKILSELNKLSFQRHQDREKDGFYIAAKFGFSPKKWIINRISPHLYLLTPRSAHNVLKNYQFSLATDPKPTDIELAVGLRINHFPEVTATDFMNSDYHDDSFSGAQIVAYEFLLALPELFVRNKEYVAAAQQNIHIEKPIWAVYMQAHGSVGETSISEISYFAKKSATAYNFIYKLLGNPPYLQLKSVLDSLKNRAPHYSDCINKIVFSSIDVGKRKQALRQSFSVSTPLHQEDLEKLSLLVAQFKALYDEFSDCLKDIKNAEFLVSKFDPKSAEFDKSKINSAEMFMNEFGLWILKFNGFSSMLAYLAMYLKNEYQFQNLIEKKIKPTFKDAKIGPFDIPQFREILDFFGMSVLTNFFFFNTCFFGGDTLQYIYQEYNQYLGQKTYPYTIASGAISEGFSTTTTNVLRLPPVLEHQDVRAMMDHDTLRIVNENRFNLFFDFLQEREVASFEAAIDAIHKFRDVKYLRNLPILKFPGLEWTRAIDLPETVVSIDSILASTRDQNKPLYLATFFGGRTFYEEKLMVDPDTLLLYTTNVPFPLVQNGKNRIHMVSMVAGDAYHQLVSYAHTNDNLASFLMHLNPIEGLKTKKVFLFKNLKLFNELPQGSPVGVSTLTDCLVFQNVQDPLNKQASNGFYCKKNEKIYRSWWKDLKTFSQDFNKNLQEFDQEYLPAWQQLIQQTFPKTAAFQGIRDVSSVREFSEKHPILQHMKKREEEHKHQRPEVQKETQEKAERQKIEQEKQPILGKKGKEEID